MLRNKTGTWAALFLLFFLSLFFEEVQFSWNCEIGPLALSFFRAAPQMALIDEPESYYKRNDNTFILNGGWSPTLYLALQDAHFIWPGKSAPSAPSSHSRALFAFILEHLLEGRSGKRPRLRNFARNAELSVSVVVERFFSRSLFRFIQFQAWLGEKRGNIWMIVFLSGHKQLHPRNELLLPVHYSMYMRGYQYRYHVYIKTLKHELNIRCRK